MISQVLVGGAVAAALSTIPYGAVAISYRHRDNRLAYILLLAGLGVWNAMFLTHILNPDPLVKGFFLALSVVSGLVRFAGYRLLLETASELSGGLFIALIGDLLVVTGVVQRAAGASVVPEPELPRAIDAIIVVIGQGLAVLPDISRSGTTVSLLLLRGDDGETAFDLSFVLAIPASLGAGLFAITDIGGISGLSLESVILAFSASAVVGYLTIGVLLRLVQRVAFWGVCIGFGALAILGGVLIVVL